MKLQQEQPKTQVLSSVSGESYNAFLGVPQKGYSKIRDHVFVLRQL